MAQLKGKRVLVVGGETPLGRALAVGLAEAGAAVAITTLTKTTEAEFAINSALNELWAIGRRGLALALDASDADELRGAVERAQADLGRLDAAAVVGDQGGAADIKALRDALPERAVLDLAGDGGVEESLQSLNNALRA